MWIIPKCLHKLASVANTERVILDLNDLSALSEKALTARSNLLSATTWLRKWKQVSLISHLYGRVLKPSIGAMFESEWTSFQEESLIRHLAKQGEYRICEPIPLEGSENLDDLPLFSSKMWEASFKAPSRLLFCSTNIGSWKDWVTRQRQEYSQRQSSEFHTNGSVHLGKIWKTPTTTDVGREANLVTKDGQPWKGEGRAYRLDGSLKQTTLQYQVEQTEGGICHSENLWDAARTSEGTHQKNWATPNTMDILPPRSPEALKRHLTNGARTGRTSSGNLREQVCVYPWGASNPHQEITHPVPPMLGQLNPRWVENLMGLPIGWVMPRCQPFMEIVTERESSLPLQGELSESYGSESLTPKSWLTPIVGDAHLSLTKPLSKYEGAERINTLLRQVSEEQDYSGQLNPRWVENLMGLPIGWVLPSCLSLTAIVCIRSV